MTIFYDPRCLEYSSRGHPERPERIARTAPLIKQRHPDWEWRVPQAATANQLLPAPFRQHIERVPPGRGEFDPDTPYFSNLPMYWRRCGPAALEAPPRA